MLAPMRRALALTAPLAVLALAGCGESLIDTDKGEKLVRSAVAEQTGARVASVACPEDVKIKRGATFRCVVTGTDRSKGDAVVRQTDDKGNVHVDAAFCTCARPRR